MDINLKDLTYLHRRLDKQDLDEKDEAGNSIIIGHLEKLLMTSERYTNGALALGATIKRILILIRDCKETLPPRFFPLIIDYIKRVWDHKVDSVCHDSNEIFSTALIIHKRSCAGCKSVQSLETKFAPSCHWAFTVFRWLISADFPNKSTYKCLSAFFTDFPSSLRQLEENDIETFYRHLNNHSLANSVSEVLVQCLRDQRCWSLHIYHICRFVDYEKCSIDILKTRLIKLIEKDGTLTGFLEALLASLTGSTSARTLDTVLAIVRCLIRAQKSGKPLVEKREFIMWTQYISSETMACAILHSDIHVALSAFNVIIDHPKRTCAFVEYDLEFMKAFFVANLSSQLPGVRQSILAGLKNGSECTEPVLKKMRKNDSFSGKDTIMIVPETHCVGSMQRERVEICDADEFSDENTDGVDDVKLYTSFVRYIWDRCFDSLAPEGNFNRRLMALYTIELLYNRDLYTANGKTGFVDHLNLNGTLNCLRMYAIISCLDDSYELIRTKALSILRTLEYKIEMVEEEYIQPSDELTASVNDTSTSASACRMQLYMSQNPHRLQPVLELLADTVIPAIERASENLTNIIETPVHTNLSLLADLMENTVDKNYLAESMEDPEKRQWWSNFCNKKLLPPCFKAADIVIPVVHNPNPEGYIPQDTLEDCFPSSVEEQADFAQRLLVCCWRTQRFVSQIFGWVFENLAEYGIVEVENVKRVGDFYLRELTQGKHKGAFETSVDGFEKLCRFLWKSTNEEHPKPIKWLEEIMDVEENSQRLLSPCSTRRSAGLPYLVVAITITEPDGSISFDYAIECLFEMTMKSLDLRIHAMNIMKGMVTNSGLSEPISMFLESLLFVALKGCCAVDFIERNSASQLFSALRTRVFGVTRSAVRSYNADPKNRQSGYEFFNKYPELYSFMVEQLRTNSSPFAVVPPLVILSHLYPTTASDAKYPLAPFVPLCLHIAIRNKFEHIRTQAVIALLSISDSETFKNLACWIGEIQFGWIRQNHIFTSLQIVRGMYAQDQSRSFLANIVSEIVRTKIWLNWKDFVVSYLLKLCNKFNIDFDMDDVVVEKPVLVKRPIAERLLRSNDVLKAELSPWLKDYETRRQCFIIIQKKGWDFCNKYLWAQMINLAIRDLPEAPQQVDSARILNLLYPKHTMITEESREKLCQFIRQELYSETSLWNLFTKSTACKLLTKLEMPSADEREALLEWINGCSDVDEDSTRLNALCVARDLSYTLKNNCDDVTKEFKLSFIRTVSLFLQDCEHEIREMASEVLSPFLGAPAGYVLNPFVCRILVADHTGDYTCDKRFEDDLIPNEPLSESVDRDALFAACAENGYREQKYFGDVDLFKDIYNLIDRAPSSFIFPECD
ncbi:unnamed protein product [Caenorhabditis auriculariae]|uniref:tRNA (32-2'-O)-methyltransferase regulator THADA n=1 Tax=Caenorhabditis auriculariae TaxID=2777116 RepID=A0A8S1GN57_9PELO|nr:unnamed protein product [Caenorhabditis auriculariae]